MKKLLLFVLIFLVVAVSALMIFKGKAVKRRAERLISEWNLTPVKDVQITFDLAQSGVTISVDDSEGTIYQDKNAIITVPEGLHRFLFTKPGYEDLQKEITAQKDEAFAIALKKIEVVQERIPLSAYVVINSVPEGAAILINNKRKGITPATVKLDAGSYTMALQSNNYHDYIASFSLEEDQTLSLATVELSQKFAYYSVKAAPEGAVIFLDNVLVESTSVEKTALSSGKHQLRIQKDQYYDFSQEFEVSDGELREFEVRLKATFGSLAIDSEPEDGARVYIDEKLVGKTPYLNEKIDPGQYRVRVEKELCIGAEKIVTVYEDERTAETLIMTRNYALIVIDAPGCEIFINNEHIGYDHCEIKLETGQYQLKCTRDNHHTVVETIYADPAHDLSFFLEPEPMLADLSVESKPAASAGAQIWLNDEMMQASTPWKFNLLPGEYDVSVKHKYFHDQNQHVSLAQDESSYLLFKLKARKDSPVGRAICWERSKWTSLTTTLLLAGAGVYYNYQGEQSYDQYNDAVTTTSAVRRRQDCDDLLQKRDYAYSFSVIPAAWFFYSWYKQNQNRKLTTE